MVTAEQNSANLGSASNVAAYNIGLDITQASAWNDYQKTAFTRSLAAVILAAPNSFSTATIDLANKLADFQLPDSPGAVGNPSFDYDDWSEFGYYLEQNAVSAGTKLGDLGNGVLNAISSVGGTIGNSAQAAQNLSAVSQLILPIGAVILLWWLVKDPVKASSATRNFAGATRELLPY